MKTARMWKVAAGWLRRVDPGQGKACGVAECRERPSIAVAGEQSERLLCAYHAVAWSETTLGRDHGQHGSGVTPADLSAWVGASQLGA